MLAVERRLINGEAFTDVLHRARPILTGLLCKLLCLYWESVCLCVRVLCVCVCVCVGVESQGLHTGLWEPWRGRGGEAAILLD